MTDKTSEYIKTINTLIRQLVGNGVTYLDLGSLTSAERKKVVVR